MTNKINKEQIEKLLPHREPMLLIDSLINIVPLKSATAIMLLSFFHLVLQFGSFICRISYIKWVKIKANFLNQKKD